eukprot:6200542-Pleurochrysis_carterae.AAC.1
MAFVCLISILWGIWYQEQPRQHGHLMKQIIVHRTVALTALLFPTLALACGTCNQATCPAATALPPAGFAACRQSRRRHSGPGAADSRGKDGFRVPSKGLLPVCSYTSSGIPLLLTAGGSSHLSEEICHREGTRHSGMCPTVCISSDVGAIAPL